MTGLTFSTNPLNHNLIAMLNFLNQYGERYGISAISVGDTTSENLSAELLTLYRTQAIIRQRSKETITFSQPIITSLGEGCIYPNTINVIQGRKGVHKSRLTEIISTILLCVQFGKELIGFRQRNIERYSLLYVDTERNQRDQFPAAIQRIKLASGYAKTDDVASLDFISLIDIIRTQRLETLKQYLEHFRQNHDGHVVIVLDVITDCVENFNDPRESMRLIDLMNVMVNNQNVTFICVIHENPGGGDKARGHLGTEVVNKASQVMQISFVKDSQQNDTDLIQLKFLHSRNTKRLEPVMLRYSEEARSLILAEPEFLKEQRDKRLIKSTPAELKEWLRQNLTHAHSKNELIEELMVAFDCKRRTLEDRLTELTQEGFLLKVMENRKAMFSLAIA